ncbi:MAG: sigma-70 family RNA polymerase sigma factor [Oscillospiraceae bacterium]|nr:sigma-70 family RNA polymerase sigma factor [Oscillospiraceae bacterium]
MDKKYVDEIIAGYMQKIFGFALSKTINTDKAEELASRITFDVYTSLLKAGEVYNINGYIYRVASNVYARFVNEKIKGRYISLDEVNIPCENDFTIDFEKNEDYIRLRKEISYLGKIQREIIVMHYFQKLKLYEIAERLNIPLGTVKWHLHDARNQLKNKLEDINKMSERINLGMNPVKIDFGMSGNPGPENKNTSYYLSKLISQNVVYAAYYEPKTITEIAEELGVPAAFIEDEVAYLEDYSFLDKIAGGKYQTNIFIREPSKEVMEEIHKLFLKYAKVICEKYIPLLFDTMKNYKSMKIYTPENDFNFLMWSIIGYSCRYMLRAPFDWGTLSRYNVKRKDGGEYIALGYVKKDIKVNYNEEKYNVPNNMTRGSSEHIYNSWQLNSYYDSRPNTYIENKSEDYEYLYEYIAGKITKIPEYADKFKRLFDKGYLIQKNDSEYVNMIISKDSENDFKNLLPGMTEELKLIGEEFDKEIYNLEKSQYPAHMHDLYRAWCTNCLSDQNMVAYVLEILLANGTLKPLTENQKHSVNTIMFCDTLPE